MSSKFPLKRMLYIIFPFEASILIAKMSLPAVLSPLAIFPLNIVAFGKSLDIASPT
ncbi:hypothetical protein [Methanobrevibacter smithii]|uniref:hypothetical protein n=1 Tax=Methanobrevibacter smithii TaxID=2173 RepID=UPI0037DC9120